MYNTIIIVYTAVGVFAERIRYRSTQPDPKDSNLRVFGWVMGLGISNGDVLCDRGIAPPVHTGVCTRGA